MHSTRARPIGDAASSSGAICGIMDAYNGKVDAMNKIVREHYPVANLPEDLREGLAAGATVRVVLEVEEATSFVAKAKLETWAQNYWALKPEDRKPMSSEELAQQMQLLREADRTPISTEQAVADIRVLRDEWDKE